MVKTKSKEYKSKELVDEVVRVFEALKEVQNPYMAVAEIARVEECKITYQYEEIKSTQLSNLLDTNGTITIEKAIKYCLQVANALQTLHSLKIMHLDIKPSNILIKENDDAILVDFDNSRVFVGDEQKKLMGYPFFYAPEEIRKETASFCPNIDYFMLVGVFYEMILGQKPPIRKLADVSLNDRFQRIVQLLQDNTLTKLSLGECPEVYVKSCFEISNNNYIEEV